MLYCTAISRKKSLLRRSNPRRLTKPVTRNNRQAGFTIPRRVLSASEHRKQTTKARGSTEKTAREQREEKKKRRREEKKERNVR